MIDLATPQEIARQYGVGVRYVYNLAALHRWQRVKWQRRVYYRWTEADRHLGRDAVCVSG